MLTLIVPTYNERDNLAPLVARLEAARRSLHRPLEVLVVDSASPDGTAQLARDLLEAARLGRVIQRPVRGDFGEAVLEGLRNASGGLVGLMDADLSHPPELLPQLVEAIDRGADLAVASRYVPGGGTRGWPAHRRWLSSVANALAHPLAPVADVTSGYFVCRSSVVQPPPRAPGGFKVLLELIVRRCLHQVEEVPYVFVDRMRGASKLGSRVLGAYALQLARLYAHRLRHPCPHRRSLAQPSRSVEPNDCRSGAA